MTPTNILNECIKALNDNTIWLKNKMIALLETIFLIDGNYTVVQKFGVSKSERNDIYNVTKCSYFK